MYAPNKIRPARKAAFSRELSSLAYCSQRIFERFEETWRSENFAKKTPVEEFHAQKVPRETAARWTLGNHEFDETVEPFRVIFSNYFFYIDFILVKLTG